jgi:hypothetical protein
MNPPVHNSCCSESTLLTPILSVRECASRPRMLSDGGGIPHSHALREPSHSGGARSPCTYTCHCCIYVAVRTALSCSLHTAVFMLAAPLSPRTALHCTAERRKHGFITDGRQGVCEKWRHARSPPTLPANDLRIPIRYLLPLSHTQRSSVKYGQH